LQRRVIVVVAANYARRGYALYIFASQILLGVVDFGLARAHRVKDLFSVS
jgi:hypothetical protein